MEKPKRGSAESSWHAARRCLAIMNQLMAEPATKKQLCETIEALGLDPSYVAHPKRFDNDKVRLREKLGIHITYSKAEQGYIIAERERPLLNLPDQDLETLAYLAATFHRDAPKSLEVNQLIDLLVSWLPAERQKVIQQLVSIQPTPELRLRDSEPIDERVWEVVTEAWQAKQELQFDYVSGKHADAQIRHHRIQPWEITFTERGHWRLRGYCLFNNGPNGAWEPKDYINYRMSRIVSGSAKVLPKRLPSVRPNGRLKEAIFDLSPTVAKFGVSQRRELHGIPTETALDDGWVRVSGKTNDVFDLARNLLYYGANCRVVGGDALLFETKKLVSSLAKIYQSNV